MANARFLPTFVAERKSRRSPRILSFAAVSVLAMLGVLVGLRARAAMTQEDFDWIMQSLRLTSRTGGGNA